MSRLSSPASSLADDEETPGYDFEFVEELKDEYTCSVCHMAMRNPVQTTCGHRYCRGCVVKMCRMAAGDKWSCPKDRTLLPRKQGFFPDEAWKRDIWSLKIKCKQNDEGCDWTGELSQYQHHYPICKYVSVSCDGCKEDMKRMFLGPHKASQCAERITDCQYCHQQFPFRILEVHQDENCPLFPLDCLQKCEKKKIPREEMDAHIKDDCPLTKIPCPFQISGCTVQELRGKMGIHFKKDNLRHLYGACSRLEEVQQKVNEYGSLRQRVGELEKENVSMKLSLDMYNQEIQGLKTKEKGQKKKISQMKQQLAELHKEKEKTQLLEKRVRAMEGRFQAMGNALCLSDGEGHSEIQEVKKRKVEDKAFRNPSKEDKVQASSSFQSDDFDESDNLYIDDWYSNLYS